MTARSIVQGLATALITALLTGCSVSPATRFYTLDATATADGSPAAAYSVGVGPVSVPASVDRSQLVVQVAPNRVAVEEFDVWASPLSEAIARVVTSNLVTLLGTPRVASMPLANFDPAYRVTIDVQRFESLRGEAAVIEAVWVVRPSSGGPAHSGRTAARETVADAMLDALAAAHSRALAAVSRDIAAAIRASAAEPPSAAPTKKKAR